MTRWLPASVRAPLAYVDDLAAPALAGDDAHHLRRVLRVRPGEEIAVSDGRGRWRLCRFGSELEPVSAVNGAYDPADDVSICVAIAKGERPDWMIQKLTEIGIDRITFIQADRSVVDWSYEKLEKNLERFRRIGRSAAAQSRRTRLPVVDGVAAFAEAAARPGTALAAVDGGLIADGCRNVLIGPEGGWSVAERHCGVAPVSLGPQVLRVETAALVAATLLVFLRSQVVARPSIPPENAPSG